MFNNTVAGYDRIWQVAMNVWKGITSAMVSRAFFLAYRIMRKIIEENGTHCQNSVSERIPIFRKT